MSSAAAAAAASASADDDDTGEFRPNFVSDEPIRMSRGKDMSILAPGAGEQRSIIEGEMGYLKNRLLRPEATREQMFQRDAAQYLIGAYPSQDAGWRQQMVEEALHVPNYHNLYIGMFMAALYFRQRSGVIEYRNLKPAILTEYAPLVLKPMLSAASLESKKLKLKKFNAEDLQLRLKADLLRYLRFILQ